MGHRNENIRIGHFLYHYPQPGGTTTSVRGLAQGLARLGHEITIYCCGNGGQSRAADASAARTVWSEGTRRNPFHTPGQIARRIANNEDKLDLLVIHGMFNPRNIAVAQAARQARLPYVVCPQGAYHPDMLKKRRWAKCVYAWRYERPLLNAALAIQVFAADQIAQLTKFGVERSAFVVPNGFDPAEVPRAVSQADGGPCAVGPRLLFMGRIDTYTKGLDLLLSALSLGLTQRRLPAELTLDVVGPDWGDQAALAKSSAKLGLGRNVRFPGPVEGGERWLALRSHDLTVLPSRHDAFGLVILESMVAARPLIVSSACGSSAFVRQAQCGFVVNPTAESILSGIVQAIESRDQWHTLGDRGRAFAYAQLTWDRVAETAMANYERVLSQSTCAGAAA